MNKYAVLVCSRYHSSRLPSKAFIEFQGIPAVKHLTYRLVAAGFPVHVLVPEMHTTYSALLDEKCVVALGPHDPLARMARHAVNHSLEFVVRVTHDKIFIDTDELNRAIETFKTSSADYMYSSTLTDGTGFEIISTQLLVRAHAKYTDVEHISYAVKALAERPFNYRSSHGGKPYRLLLDYPEDVQLFELLFSQLGPHCSLSDVIRYLDEFKWFSLINLLPEVSVYTCVHNGEDFIRECIRSVVDQKVPFNFEYIVVDDCSTDRTLFNIALFNNELKWVRNKKNLGLASSSNVALGLARGKYIVRMDADDFFSSKESLFKMYYELKRQEVDALYPANYYGSWHHQQKGNEQHHVGGALFSRQALEFLRFKDGLRHYEGLELFTRAQKALRIGYHPDPMFFYRQTGNSMSKTNLAEREAVKDKILKGELQ